MIYSSKKISNNTSVSIRLLKKTKNISKIYNNYIKNYSTSVHEKKLNILPRNHENIHLYKKLNIIKIHYINYGTNNMKRKHNICIKYYENYEIHTKQYRKSNEYHRKPQTSSYINAG